MFIALCFLFFSVFAQAQSENNEDNAPFRFFMNLVHRNYGCENEICFSTLFDVIGEDGKSMKVVIYDEEGYERAVNQLEKLGRTVVTGMFSTYGGDGYPEILTSKTYYAKTEGKGTDLIGYAQKINFDATQILGLAENIIVDSTSSADIKVSWNPIENAQIYHVSLNLVGERDGYIGSRLAASGAIEETFYNFPFEDLQQLKSGESYVISVQAYSDKLFSYWNDHERIYLEESRQQSSSRTVSKSFTLP